MKKWILICCAALVATSAWAAKEMSVQVRDGQLRNRASFLGAVTGTVAYGDRVTVNQEQAGWCEVTTSAGATGWIHGSALTPKRVVAGSGMVTAVGSSCTVNGTPSLVSRAQWSAFTVLFTSATAAVVVGDLASS